MGLPAPRVPSYLQDHDRWREDLQDCRCWQCSRFDVNWPLSNLNIVTVAALESLLADNNPPNAIHWHELGSSNGS